MTGQALQPDESMLGRVGEDHRPTATHASRNRISAAWASSARS
jgi:hypothetical protein